jgi:hypothetical protein
VFIPWKAFWYSTRFASIVIYDFPGAKKSAFARVKKRPTTLYPYIEPFLVLLNTIAPEALTAMKADDALGSSC